MSVDRAHGLGPVMVSTDTVHKYVHTQGQLPSPVCVCKQGWLFRQLSCHFTATARFLTRVRSSPYVPSGWGKDAFLSRRSEEKWLGDILLHPSLCCLRTICYGPDLGTERSPPQLEALVERPPSCLLLGYGRAGPGRCLCPGQPQRNHV